jgi:hypothetical protein
VAKAADDLGGKEWIVEQRHRRPAQQKVLLHLMLTGPWHVGLVLENVLSRQMDHRVSTAALTTIPQRSL